MRKISWILVLSACFGRVAAQAQPAAPKADFKLFFEKAYLHTDREYYAAGEEIWYKAYLVNARGNKLLSASNNLYVELITPASTIVSREMIRLDDGLGNGEIKLSDTLSPGTYRLRAYTNWQLNFGNNLLFEKPLHIYADIKNIPNGVTTLIAKKTKPVKIAAPLITPISKPAAAVATINFYPEGGSLVEGVAGVVGLKAEDANGHGLKITGSIYADDGAMVSSFESNAYGLSSFLLSPQPGKSYQARGIFPNGKSFSVNLPFALQQGYSLNIRNGDSILRAVITTNAATLAAQAADVKLTLKATSKGEQLFSAEVSLQGRQAVVNIPRAALPAGITELTVTDAQGRPQCQRLVYNEVAPAFLKIATTQSFYAPKTKTVARIRVADEAGLAQKAKLSVAVVDAGLVPPDAGDIRSYLYLASELRGSIENAAQYFDVKNLERKQQLDLLLLTQGWRDFVWKRLADSALRISYEPETGLTVAGRVRGIWSSKGQPALNITLYADEAKGDKLLTTRTDTKGQYAFYGLNLTGPQQVILSSVDDKGKKSGYVLIDTILKTPFQVRAATELVDSANALRFNDAIIKRSVAAKKYHVTDTVPLAEVRVTAQPLLIKRTTIDTTISMTRKDYQLKTLAEYIAERVPGAILSRNHQRVSFLVHGVTKSPVVTVDSLIPYGQIRRIRGIIWDIPLEKVFDLRYRQVFIFQTLSFQQKAWGFTSPAVFPMCRDCEQNDWIELKLKPHALDDFDFHTSHYDIDGYYQARTFYAPKYAVENNTLDYRTTIHWEPLVTAEFGEAVVSWFNASPKTKVRIIAEGITADGRPVAGTAEYEVK